KWRPSGKNQGYRCVVSCREESIRVTGEGVPPESGMRLIGAEGDAKRITPWRLHVPPIPLGAASHRTTGGPPETSIRFNFPSAKKPTDFASGDQKGKSAFSVPASGCAATLSSGCTQSCLFAPGAPATKAIRPPSGEIVTKFKKRFSGRRIEERTA